MKFTAIFEKSADGFIAFLEELPGARAEGASIEEARRNLRVALELVIYENRLLAEELVQDRPVYREAFCLGAALRGAGQVSPGFRCPG